MYLPMYRPALAGLAMDMKIMGVYEIRWAGNGNGTYMSVEYYRHLVTASKHCADAAYDRI